MGPAPINPSFLSELKQIVDFEVRFSFKRNYQVVIPSPSNAIDDLAGCVTIYLKALEHGLRFSLPKVIMRILRTYNIAVTQLVLNA